MAENNQIPDLEGQYNKPSNVRPFVLFMKQNFPFIENTYEALDIYGLLEGIVAKLNEVVSNLNKNEENIDFLNTNFTILRNFVDNYFTNLDVQEEINQKLDEMAESGVLTQLLQTYVVDVIDPQIKTLDAKITATASGSPAGTYATVSDLTNANPDHSRIYLVLADKNWYYFSPTNNTWAPGGLYLSNGAAENQVTRENLSVDLKNYVSPNILEFGGYSEGYSGKDSLIKINNTINARSIVPFRSINQEVITLSSDVYEFFTIYYNLDGSYFGRLWKLCSSISKK